MGVSSNCRISRAYLSEWYWTHKHSLTNWVTAVAGLFCWIVEGLDNRTSLKIVISLVFMISVHLIVIETGPTELLQIKQWTLGYSSTSSPLALQGSYQNLSGSSLHELLDIFGRCQVLWMSLKVRIHDTATPGWCRRSFWLQWLHPVQAYMTASTPQYLD